MAKHDPEPERKYGPNGRLVRITIPDGAELYVFRRGMKEQAILVAVINVNGSRGRRYSLTAPLQVVKRAQAEFDRPVDTDDIFGYQPKVETKTKEDRPEVLWCNGTTVAIRLPSHREVRLREDKIGGRKDITPEVGRLAMAVIKRTRQSRQRRSLEGTIYESQTVLFPSVGADKHY